MQQIGRNVYHEERIERVIKLSLLSKVRKKYYEFRVKLIERRIKKWGQYALGYRHELFRAAVYEKQAYLHKVEAVIGKDELRMLKKLWKRNIQNSKEPSIIKPVRKRDEKNE